jgi:hypothetical protein
MAFPEAIILRIKSVQSSTSTPRQRAPFNSGATGHCSECQSCYDQKDGYQGAQQDGRYRLVDSWLQQAVGIHKNHNSAAANQALAGKIRAEPDLRSVPSIPRPECILVALPLRSGRSVFWADALGIDLCRLTGSCLVPLGRTGIAAKGCSYYRHHSLAPDRDVQRQAGN